MKIGIIGGGKVGSCLAGYLQQHLTGITASGYEKTAQLAQRFGTPCYGNAELTQSSEIILLTVPDRKIAAVAADLAARAQVQNKVFLHCSGSLGLEPLIPLQDKGAYIGSLHPLQSFAGGYTNLQGVYMAIDGNEQAATAAQKIIALLGGHAFYVPAAERAAYHAAACICSNYVVAVEALAQRLMSRWLGDEAAAWQALLPLFQGTAANLQGTANPAQALTGPIARGDVPTIHKHLQALPQEYVPIYCSLGRETTQLALTGRIIDANTAQQLEAIFKAAQTTEDLND